MLMNKKESFFKLKEDFSLLIILMGSLGDVARGLCITHYIKEKYPKSKITWVIEKSLKDLASLDKNIDNVIVFNKKDKLKAFLDVKKEIQKEKYDIVFDMQRILKSGILSLFSKAPIRVGFSIKDSKEFNFLFNNKYISYFTKSTPKIIQYIDFLKFLDIDLTSEEKEKLVFSYANNIAPKEEFKNIFDGNKTYIGLVLASMWKSKDWDIKNYVELINKLDNKDYAFVLIGTNAQKELSNYIKENVKDKKEIIDFCGKTTLVDLLFIIKNLKVGVGPDSGAGHLFGALKTPYISLFGPTIPDRVCPYNMRELVLQTSLPCIPCYKKVCPLKHNDCMKKITPDLVTEKLLEVLNNNGE